MSSNTYLDSRPKYIRRDLCNNYRKMHGLPLIRRRHIDMDAPVIKRIIMDTEIEIFKRIVNGEPIVYCPVRQ